MTWRPAAQVTVRLRGKGALLDQSDRNSLAAVSSALPEPTPLSRVIDLSSAIAIETQRLKRHADALPSTDPFIVELATSLSSLSQELNNELVAMRDGI
jgi:hypothetical protein